MEQEHPKLEMGEHFHAKHAHKYVAAYLFIVVLLAVTGGVYAWQHKKAEQLTARVDSLKAQRVALIKQMATIADQKATAPATGLKSYCDTTHGPCFRYPAAWTLNASKVTTNGVAQTIATVTDPDKLVQVTYSNPFSPRAAGNFYTQQVVGLGSSGAGPALALKIVGGYFTDSAPYAPFYEVVDDPSVFQPGKVTSGVFATQFTGKNNQVVHFQAIPSAGDFSTAAKTQAWFSTDAAKAALTVLQSLYYK
ncbi:MAG TPA: hypothetical protein VJR27_00185 [Candidatus Saccharimonadales bacterium]|nr:hypothetical protein [Candidatus Saccharimonadales bacterium]